jgi:hypothetical protein
LLVPIAPFVEGKFVAVDCALEPSGSGAIMGKFNFNTSSIRSGDGLTVIGVLS